MRCTKKNGTAGNYDYQLSSTLICLISLSTIYCFKEIASWDIKVASHALLWSQKKAHSNHL